MSSGQTVFLFAALMLSSLFMPWVESAFQGKLVPWDAVSHARDEKIPWQVTTPERVGLHDRWSARACGAVEFTFMGILECGACRVSAWASVLLMVRLPG
jgi:hypothetical protein